MGHAVPVFPKQPGESATLGFNWQSVLDQKSSVALSSATVASTLMSDGSSSTSTFLSSTVCTVSGSNTTFRVVSGTDGQNHKVTVSATFSDGDVLQADLMSRFVTSKVMSDETAMALILLCAVVAVVV